MTVTSGLSVIEFLKYNHVTVKTWIKTNFEIKHLKEYKPTTLGIDTIDIETFITNEKSYTEFYLGGWWDCYKDDYGFDKSYKKFLALHLNKKDLVILISSSGESKNILNAAKFVKSKKNTVITFTGFKKNNSLKRIGDINFWVNSNYYNIIENVHQCWLLFLVDFFKMSKNK